MNDAPIETTVAHHEVRLKEAWAPARRRRTTTRLFGGNIGRRHSLRGGNRPCRAGQIRWTNLLALLGFVGFVFCVSLTAGWFVRRYQQAKSQREVVDAMRRLQGTIYYDDQYIQDQAGERLLDEPMGSALSWLPELLRRDFRHGVFYITFAKFRGTVTDRIPVDRNEVTDAELSGLGDLRDLRWLALTGTRVTEAGLEPLVALPRLERLWLSFTRIGDAGMQSVARMPAMRHLYLEGTHVTDAGLERLASLPHIERLGLSGLRVTDAGLQCLGDAPSLQDLFLDKCPVTDSGLRYLASLPNLRTLSVSKTAIGDSGLANLRSIITLEELHLDGTRVSDQGLAHLAGVKRLRALTLGGDAVSDAGLIHLKALRRLTRLGLAGTDCSLSGVFHLFMDLQERTADEALAAVAQLQRDETGEILSLDLSQIRVQDAGLSRLGQLPSLEWLSLAGSEVTDAGLAHLDSLRNLTLLNLNGTRVTDAGLSRLARLPKLRTLHVANTKVTERGIQQFTEAFLTKIRFYTVEFTPKSPRLPGSQD